MASKYFQKASHGLCRAVVGHAWQPEGALQVESIKRHDRKQEVYTLRVECLRCHAERVDRISIGSGEVVRRGYTYEAGYRLTLDGETLPRKDVLRKDAITALLPRSRRTVTPSTEEGKE